jgi:hypothetical protein
MNDVFDVLNGRFYSQGISNKTESQRDQKRAPDGQTLPLGRNRSMSLHNQRGRNSVRQNCFTQLPL